MQPGKTWHLVALNEPHAVTHLGDFKELGRVQHSAVLCPLHSVPSAFINPLDTCRQQTHRLQLVSGPMVPQGTVGDHLPVQEEEIKKMARFC